MNFVKMLFLVLLPFQVLMAADDPKAGVEALKVRLNRSGSPKIDGTAMVAGKSVPNISFGKIKIANNFDAVNEVKTKLGGTATVFVKDGDEYVRISTNVIKEDGSKAIGTTLAKNKAYESIKKGELFCGEVEILGVPYNTCYDPIKDGNNVIGIYYFGYKK